MSDPETLRANSPARPRVRVRLRSWSVVSAAALGLALTAALGSGLGRLAAQDRQARPPNAVDENSAGSYMYSLANPAEAGRTGPRLFTRTAFDAGNIAWVALAGMGTLLIAPGWLFFYGGRAAQADLARAAGQFFLLAVLLSLVWIMAAYSFSFGPNWGATAVVERDLRGIDGIFSGSPYIGGTSHLALQGLDPQTAADEREFPLRRRTDSVPHVLFLVFQMMVALVAPAPLIALTSDRVKTGPLVVVLLAWSVVVYVPLAHWIWGFGWLRERGALDYAGGAVVHVAAGFSALAGWLVLPRPLAAGFSATCDRMGPIYLGGALLWAGMVCLNAGSAFGASPAAVQALFGAHIAACAGSIGWAGAEWLRRGRATVGDAVAGAAAGLVAISAGSGLVAAQSALVTGLAGGVVCRAACALVNARHSGVPQTVFAIQGIGGMLGMLLTGVFASSTYAGSDDNATPIEGLLIGDDSLLRHQALAAAVAALYAVVGTGLILLVVRAVAGNYWRRCEESPPGPGERGQPTHAVSA